MRSWLFLGLIACAPQTSASSALPAHESAQPASSELAPSSRDHVDAELGFRLRLPPGCVLARAEQTFTSLGPPVPATWLSCEHELGKLELWVVEQRRVATLGVEALIDFVRGLPTSMPMHDPLASDLSYWGSTTTDDGLQRARWFRAIGSTYVFGELSTRETDRDRLLVTMHSLRPADADTPVAPSHARADDASIAAAATQVAGELGLTVAAAEDINPLVASLEPAPRSARLERDGELFARVYVSFAGPSEDLELLLTITRRVQLSMPADGGASVFSSFENDRIEQFGERGELSRWRLQDQSLASVNYVWLRCGHVVHLFARGEHGEALTHTLARRLDEELARRWCAG